MRCASIGTPLHSSRDANRASERITTVRHRGRSLVVGSCSCTTSRAVVVRHGGLPPGFASRFAGGLGAVMVVDYASSDGGPYQELLFVPGRFRAPDGALYYAITRIFVSTQVSVDSGIQNWGIPKERADFQWSREDTLERVRVAQGDMPVAEFAFSSNSPGVLVTTDIVPSRFRTLAQLGANGETVFTAPSGRGTVRLAKLERVTVNPALFPDLSEFKPLVVTKAEPFQLGFPVPQKKRLAWT
ncbi:MAG: acetoacetate decarboxylase family protein [Pleurocapsa sp. SU_196_0]|nr:acetoacetate decarboxylase family protein [Pleurocapsa sp. SU_196_0]